MTEPVYHSRPTSLQKSLRIPVLAVLLSSAMLVLGRAIVTPKSFSSVSVTALSQSVPLEGWQLTATTPLKSIGEGVKGQLYQYRSPDSSTPVIQVELRQMLGEGNISRFLFDYSVIRQGNSKIQERQSETGVYGVLSHNGRAYLTACINPSGGSTVTEQQFAQNRSQDIWQVGRIVPWIMGQQGSLSDKRCLWTLMSLPIDRSQPEVLATEAAYKTLETAWVPWYRWWQQNFPPTPY
jgi:cyanosortase A-associated protein